MYNKEEKEENMTNYLALKHHIESIEAKKQQDYNDRFDSSSTINI